jgi:hypothetical protein
MILLVPLLIACAPDPYPDYWEPGAGPSITAVSPASTTALAGGETVRIDGSGLAQATTVVVGTRNATIVDATDSYLDVTLPAGAPGGGEVDVAVVTPEGMAYAEGVFSYDIRGHEFWTDEVASATLYKIDCPVEVWSQGSPQAEWEYSYWCGVEFGYAGAYAFYGTGRQPGFSGDQADMVELSTLPPVGTVQVWEPGARRPPGVPYLYGLHVDGETIGITTPRDFERDLDIIAGREDMLRDYYYWYQEYPEAVEFHGPVAGVYGPDACYEQELPITGGSGDLLSLEGAPGEATGMLLGYAITEDYGHGPSHVYEYTGVVGTATGEVTGGEFRGDATGVELVYDGWSGWYFHGGVAGNLAAADLPAGTAFDVDLMRPAPESYHDLGQVEGLRDLDYVRLRPAEGGMKDSYDLLAGDALILRGSDLVVSWSPGEAPADGVDFLMVELRIYDADLDDPVWMTEVARLVAQGDDASGTLTIPASELQKLPQAVNDITPAWDLAGYWAELSVARHQLRKVSLAEPGLDDGDLVIDFIHIVNSPVMLRDR